ncbi:hypothetical protein BS17DRAFT_763042 [Gyrodon lividus]|nr:hypothetical protein BS17DRAFT_763042 [Gyrodon lividus]
MAMDIFDVQLKQAPTRVEVQLWLAEDPGIPTTLCSISSWLSLGLEIKEMDAESGSIYITDKVVVKEAGSNEEWQEDHALPLPSNIGPTQCRDTDLGYLLEQELELRQGQANEVLHSI